jgi:hypothetical protein
MSQIRELIDKMKSDEFETLLGDELSVSSNGGETVIYRDELEELMQLALCAIDSNDRMMKILVKLTKFTIK